LREVAEIFTVTGMVELEQLLWAVDYADAALQEGALDEVDTATSFLRRQGTPERPEATVAADRCEALLKAARGDLDGALADLTKVVEQPASECPFEAARSRLALGQVYRRAGYKSRANESWSPRQPPWTTWAYRDGQNAHETKRTEWGCVRREAC
jgi:hypothetical protein